MVVVMEARHPRSLDFANERKAMLLRDQGHTWGAVADRVWNMSGLRPSVRLLKSLRARLQARAQHKVYKYASVGECRQVTGCEPVGTKWLDTNKGDSKAPNYRSRWVAQQYRKAWVESIFSATPNLETVRLLLADATSRCREVGPVKDFAVMVIDI